MKTLARRNIPLLSKTVIIHFFCWFTFILIEITALYHLFPKLESGKNYMLYYGINILFFYVYKWLLNKTFRYKNVHLLVGLLLLLALFPTTIIIKFLALDMVPRGHLWFSDPVKRFEANLISNLYRTAYFAILATMYWAGEQIGHYKNQTLEAERDRLRAREDQLLTQAALAETRNAYLQQQMNPHMLFNSLNFIYNRVDRYDPVAGESVLLLSDIMRYCLEAAGEDGKAHLEEEIIQIHNLIKINEKRYDEPLNLHLNIAGDFGRYRIIPLVLFSLVENLFKHGNLKSKPNSAILTITVNQDGQLHYFSKNLKRAPSGFKRSKTLGLKNIRTRLDYAYKNNYELTLRDLTDSFETDLVVSL